MNEATKNRLILASASKTRATMLENAGVEFTVDSAKVDEEMLKSALVADSVPPRDMADALAELKARAVSYMHPGAMVLGADQLLIKEGTLFSKASTIEEARGTLTMLSGGTHELITAAAIYRDGQAIWRGLDTAKLTMRALSEDYIETYLTKLGDDAFTSVGCYQIEGAGAQLFTKVEGNHFVVLGLPLLGVLDFLRHHGMMPS
jgi:septum formation protein